MELPFELREALNQLADQYNVNQLKEASRFLTEQYKHHSGQGKRLVTQELEIAAYALVRMPATYAAVHSAMESVLQCRDFPIRSILDIGAGVGTASWAIADLTDGQVSFECLEREAVMIQLGRRLAENASCFSQIQWLQQDYSQLQEFPKADWVVASYTLNEQKSEVRQKVIEKLWNCTKYGFLIVEPGTPENFSQIAEAKAQILSMGGHAVAPCPGNVSCPLPSDDWCQFTARIARSRLHKLLKDGDVPYEDEKFSYIAMAKEPIPPTGARILRHPIKETGKITLRLCTDHGLEDRALIKKDGDAYKQARKSSAGDLF